MSFLGPGIHIPSTLFGQQIAAMHDPTTIAKSLACAALSVTFAMTLFVNPALSLIPGVAAFTYWSMLQDKDRTEFYRYVDWALTTPMMLLAILLVAKISPLYVAGVIALNTVMIWSGYKGMKSTNRDERRKWFVLGCLAFIPIIWTLSTLPFTAAIGLTLVMWILYPIVWLASEESLITGKTATITYAGMDVITKVGLVWLLGDF